MEINETMLPPPQKQKVQNPFVQDKKKLLLQNDKSFKSLNKPDKFDALEMFD